MLFGEFSIADAYFAPVVHAHQELTRCRCRPRSRRTSSACSALPGVKAWIDEALAEKRLRASSTSPTASSPLGRAPACGPAPKLRRHANLPRRRRGPRCAAGLPRQRPRLGRGRRHAARRWWRQGFLPVGTRLPGVPASARRTRNTRWRAPSARRAPGYRGFAVHAAPDVTLEQDLARRDLTINAIARRTSATVARLIDPFGGQRDLQRERAAPRDRRLSRRPGAHPARGALRGALHRLRRRARNAWR